MSTVQQIERQRAQEAAGLERKLEALNGQRRALQRTIERLRGPIDVDELVRLAKGGEVLTQVELGIVARNRPDVFNDVFDAMGGVHGDAADAYRHRGGRGP